MTEGLGRSHTMTKRGLQTSLFQYQSTDHGGALRSRRAGRGARSLTFKHSMHLVLRSTRANGKMAFSYGQNRSRVNQIIR